jgi:predicted SAM-dependent methyltransferase
MKLIIGAAETYHEGWVSTDKSQLDVTKEADWVKILGDSKADKILSEHVWEHLTIEDSRAANQNVFDFLKPGGHYRIAVPDGLHPDQSYIDYVKPGGYGAGAMDHKILYTHATLSEELSKCGFEIKKLEYWDEMGNFHYSPWEVEDGKIERSKRFDDRNSGGALKYTSLIIDAIKPF